MSLDKPKRTRRTKAQMLLARGEVYETITQPIKSSEKSNMEEIEPVLESKVGWINIYKGGRSNLYWTGGDIHPTKEDAIRIGGVGKGVIAQVQISFKDKEV